MDNVSNEVTEKVTSLLDRAYSVRIKDLDQSTSLAEEALELSRDCNEQVLIAKSLNQLSLYHMIRGGYEKSIALAKEAISYFEETGDDRGVADAKYNIAGAFYKTDNFNLGLLNLIDCQVIYQKYDDYHNMARTQKSIGTIYEFYGDVNKAVEFYEAAVESGRKAKNQNLQSNAFNPLSGIYLNRGLIDKSMNLIEQAIRMKEETGDIRGLAFSLYGRAKIFTKTREFDKAERDLKEAIRIHLEMGEKIGLAMTYHKLGALFIESGEHEKAKKHLFEALEFANKYKVALAIFKSYYLLYTIFKKENNIEQALNYLEKHNEAKERVINHQTIKIIEGYDALSQMQTLVLESQAQKERMEIIQEKNLELDSFFHRVSHDLKGPITALISLDAISRDDIKDENILKVMDMSIDQVHRMNHILDELIKLTRITHEDAEIDDINFEEIIEECKTSNKALENFDKVKIELSIQQDLSFRAPWALINTILQNLIENGIKYARIDQPSPFVKIEITEKDGHVKIIAIDNGIGMKKETGRNIFEMFYRANKKVIGSGLGLYILVRAVERLQGTVDLESEIETGSTFTVSLPMN